MTYQEIIDENEYLHMKNELLEKELHEYMDLIAIIRDIIINFPTKK